MPPGVGGPFLPRELGLCPRRRSWPRRRSSSGCSTPLRGPGGQGPRAAGRGAAPAGGARWRCLPTGRSSCVSRCGQRVAKPPPQRLSLRECSSPRGQVTYAAGCLLLLEKLFGSRNCGFVPKDVERSQGIPTLRVDAAFYGHYTPLVGIEVALTSDAWKWFPMPRNEGSPRVPRLGVSFAHPRPSQLASADPAGRGGSRPGRGGWGGGGGAPARARAPALPPTAASPRPRRPDQKSPKEVWKFDVWSQF